ncbi:hypothetical protein FGO68_gene9039 [Halteria grandinella]|uniref:Elongation factor 1-alpha n=1 Tax=Halteria grandinella TaxID=5974 RepID=A0A8J8T1I5_HALGN|nr:hypothetical protein FGO68_gene9039 [Halteria grandinella]
MEPLSQLCVGIFGPYASGKSTLAGHLVYQICPPDLKQCIENDFKKVDAVENRLKFARIFDTNEAERAAGMTHRESHGYIKSQKWNMRVTDLPGNQRYFKNFMRGIVGINVGVIVVDARTFKDNQQSQMELKDQLRATFHFGVKKFIFCVNRMDQVDYSQEIFEQVKDQTKSLCLKLGIKEHGLIWIPTSGWVGDNLVEASGNMPWYSGPTLLDALDQIEFSPDKSLIDQPFKMIVKRSMRIPAVGTVFIGLIISGKVKQGDIIAIEDIKSCFELKQIQLNNENVSEAFAGQIVGMHIRQISAKDIIPGYSISLRDHMNKGLLANQYDRQMQLTATVVILRAPNKGIKQRYRPLLIIHTARIACEVLEMIDLRERLTGELIDRCPSILKAGDAATLKLNVFHRPQVRWHRTRLSKLLGCTSFKENKTLGTFILMDKGQIVAVGQVTNVAFL